MAVHCFKAGNITELIHNREVNGNGPMRKRKAGENIFNAVGSSSNRFYRVVRFQQDTTKVDFRQFVFLGFSQDGSRLFSYRKFDTQNDADFDPNIRLGITSNTNLIYLFVISEVNRNVKTRHVTQLFIDSEIKNELALFIGQWPTIDDLVIVFGLEPIWSHEDNSSCESKLCHLSVCGIAPLKGSCNSCGIEGSQLNASTTGSIRMRCFVHSFQLEVVYSRIPPYEKWLPRLSIQHKNWIILHMGDGLAALRVTLNAQSHRPHWKLETETFEQTELLFAPIENIDERNNAISNDYSRIQCFVYDTRNGSRLTAYSGDGYELPQPNVLVLKSFLFVEPFLYEWTEPLVKANGFNIDRLISYELKILDVSPDHPECTLYITVTFDLEPLKSSEENDQKPVLIDEQLYSTRCDYFYGCVWNFENQTVSSIVHREGNYFPRKFSKKRRLLDLETGEFIRELHRRLLPADTLGRPHISHNLPVLMEKSLSAIWDPSRILAITL